MECKNDLATTTMTLATSHQAAEILGLSVQTTLELARTGKIPGIKHGNKWQFVSEQLQEWLLDEAYRQQQQRQEKARQPNPPPQPKRGANRRSLIYE
jgi:excisionase family DNA binding protein